ASGTATVAGAASTWTDNERITLGSNGAGRLTVSDGGTVTATSLVLGQNTAGSGTLDIAAGAGAGILNVGGVAGGDGTAIPRPGQHRHADRCVAGERDGRLAPGGVALRQTTGGPRRADVTVGSIAPVAGRTG